MQRLKNSLVSMTPWQRAWPLCVAMTVCVLSDAGIVTAAEIPPAHVFRTTIHNRTVWAVSGRWLTIPSAMPIPVRAWSGILLDESGGPNQKEVLLRHQHAVERLSGQVSDSAERAARLRQLQTDYVKYFDVTLLEFAGPARKCCLIVDYDIDQELEFETQHWISRPASTESATAFRMKLGTHADGTSALRLESQGAPPVRPTTSVLTAPAVPHHIKPLQKRLLMLDAPHRRKQQLSSVVQAADAFITALESSADAVDVSAALADALYRRGRALGYMELPDVITHTPVSDQAWLNREFEATYQQLARRVDMQDARYILLNIRRERRAGRRGRALDLVDVYADTHPNPVWQYKKRADLFRELKAALPAHQAAAELWLRAEKPPGPVCCVFTSSSVTVAPPFPDTAVADITTAQLRQLMFHHVNDRQQEAVAWVTDASLRDLNAPDWRLVSDDDIATAHDHDRLVCVQRYSHASNAD